LIVEQIPNVIYTSNTYKIVIDKSVWLVDIGNAKPVIDTLKRDEQVQGVFITHSHYDHIHGINALAELFPNCIFYASAETLKGLYDVKLNLSFYHEQPIAYQGDNTIAISHLEEINLRDGFSVKAYYTPGHNPGSMTFQLEKYLFTGDSFIPGTPVVTKLKGGNKEENEKSLALIHELIKERTQVCPGHGLVHSGKEALPFLQKYA